MINTVVRIVCLFICVGLILTVLNIGQNPQSYSKIKALETGIFILIEQLAAVIHYSHLSNKRDITLTNFRKFHPARLLISLQNFQYSTEPSIFLQDLMMIFLMVILSHKSLF